MCNSCFLFSSLFPIQQDGYYILDVVVIYYFIIRSHIKMTIISGFALPLYVFISIILNISGIITGSTDAIAYEGQSVTLHCGYPSGQSLTLIGWKYNSSNNPFAEIKLGVQDSTQVKDAKFENRVKINKDNGDLTLNPVNRNDLGIYTCLLIADTGVAQDQQSYNITVYVKPEIMFACSDHPRVDPYKVCTDYKGKDIASMTCQVTSYPQSSVSWLEDIQDCDKVMKNEGSICSINESVYQCSSTIRRVCPGRYTCVVTYLKHPTFSKSIVINDQVKHGEITDSTSYTGEITDSTSYTGIIIGCAVGSSAVVILITIIIIILIVCCCKNKKRRKKSPVEELHNREEEKGLREIEHKADLRSDENKGTLSKQVDRQVSVTTQRVIDSAKDPKFNAIMEYTKVDPDGTKRTFKVTGNNIRPRSDNEGHLSIKMEKHSNTNDGPIVEEVESDSNDEN